MFQGNGDNYFVKIVHCNVKVLFFYNFLPGNHLKLPGKTWYFRVWQWSRPNRLLLPLNLVSCV